MNNQKIDEINTMLISALTTDPFSLLFMKKVFHELEELNFNCCFSEADMYVSNLSDHGIDGLKAPLAWYSFNMDNHEQVHLLVGDTDNQTIKNIVLDSDIMSSAKVLVIETYHDESKHRTYDDGSENVRYIILPLLYQKGKEKLEKNSIATLNLDEFVACCIYDPDMVNHALGDSQDELRKVYDIVERLSKYNKDYMEG